LTTKPKAPAQQEQSDWTSSASCLRCETLGRLFLAGWKPQEERSAALNFGSAYHHMLELHYLSPLKPPTWDFLAQYTLTEEQIATLKTSLPAYLKAAAEYEIDPASCQETKPEARLSYGGWNAKVDQQLYKADGIYFLEHKTSAYVPNINKVEHALVAEGQISGQLYLGKNLFGSDFNGVWYCPFAHRKQLLKPILVRPDATRLAKFESDLALYLAKQKKCRHTRPASLEKNRYACMDFNRPCDFYDHCWHDVPMTEQHFTKDHWEPGLGYSDMHNEVL